MPDDPTVFHCPSCGEPVAIDANLVGETVTCPACGKEFVAFAAADDEPNEEAEHQEEPAAREYELNSLRIRNVSVARRAAIRSYSYMLICIGVCVVTIGQLAYMTWRHLHEHFPGKLRPIGYVAAALAVMMLIPPLLRRAAAFKRESRQSALDEKPLPPPDFTPLSDGSQHVRNLEEMR